MTIWTCSHGHQAAKMVECYQFYQRWNNHPCAEAWQPSICLLYFHSQSGQQNMEPLFLLHNNLTHRETTCLCHHSFILPFHCNTTVNHAFIYFFIYLLKIVDSTPLIMVTVKLSHLFCWKLIALSLAKVTCPHHHHCPLNVEVSVLFSMLWFLLVL